MHADSWAGKFLYRTRVAVVTFRRDEVTPLTLAVQAHVPLPTLGVAEAIHASVTRFVTLVFRARISAGFARSENAGLDASAE